MICRRKSFTPDLIEVRVEIKSFRILSESMRRNRSGAFYLSHKICLVSCLWLEFKKKILRWQNKTTNTTPENTQNTQLIIWALLPFVIAIMMWKYEHLNKSQDSCPDLSRRRIFYYVDIPTIDDNLKNPTWRCEKKFYVWKFRLAIFSSFQPWEKFEESFEVNWEFKENLKIP